MKIYLTKIVANSDLCYSSCPTDTQNEEFIELERKSSIKNKNDLQEFVLVCIVPWINMMNAIKRKHYYEYLSLFSKPYHKMILSLFVLTRCVDPIDEVLNNRVR